MLAVFCSKSCDGMLPNFLQQVLCRNAGYFLVWGLYGGFLKGSRHVLGRISAKSRRNFATAGDEVLRKAKDSPKGAQRKPKNAKSRQKRIQRQPKGAKREPKGSPGEGKFDKNSKFFSQSSLDGEKGNSRIIWTAI